MVNSIKYLRLLAYSTCLALSSLAALAMSVSDRWSTAWDAGAVRGRGPYYDSTGVVATGTWSQAIITDCYNAALERDLALGTSGAPEPLWWRAQRYDIVEFKAWLSINCEWFVDETKIVDGKLNDFFAGKQLFDLYELQPLLGHTEESLISQASLPTDFFSYTPWVNLATSDYGWRGIKKCFELLTILVHPDGGIHGSGWEVAHFAPLDAGTPNLWTGSASTSTWVTAKSTVDGSMSAVENAWDWEVAIGDYAYPQDYTYGLKGFDDYSARRRIVWQMWEIELDYTDLSFRGDMYLWSAAVGTYDDFGTGLLEDQFAYYATANYTAGGGATLQIPVGNTNGTLNIWCDEPTLGDPSSRGWTSVPDGYERSVATWFILDYGVEGGFKYK